MNCSCLGEGVKDQEGPGLGYYLALFVHNHVVSVYM